MIINFSYYEKLVLAFQIQWLRVVISVPLLSVITIACAFYWLCDWTPTDEESKFVCEKLLNQSNVPFSADYVSNPIVEKFVKIGLFLYD